MPSSSRTFAINAAWLSVVMLAVDLIAWTQLLLSHDDLAKAEPRRCAIGCSTSPPDSPTASAGSGCASRTPALGRIRELLAALTTPWSSRPSYLRSVATGTVAIWSTAAVHGGDPSTVVLPALAGLVGGCRVVAG